LGFSHPVYLQLHVVSALTALVMLMVLRQLGPLIVRRHGDHEPVQVSSFQDVLIAVIICTVLMDLVFYLLMMMPVKNL